MPLKKSACALSLPKDGGPWSCVIEDKPKKLKAILSKATGEPKLPRDSEELSMVVELCLWNDSAGCLRELVRLGLSPQRVFPERDVGGILFDAMGCGATACAGFLAGVADPTRVDAQGLTALMVASKRADLELMEKLLARSNLESRCAKGVSALGWCLGFRPAPQRKRKKAVKMLLKEWINRHGKESACHAALSALEMAPLTLNEEAFDVLWPWAKQADDPELVRDVAMGCAAKGFVCGFNQVWPLVDKALLSGRLPRFHGAYASTLAARGLRAEILAEVIKHGPIPELTKASIKAHLEFESPLLIAVHQGKMDMVEVLATCSVSLERQGAQLLDSVKKGEWGMPFLDADCLAMAQRRCELQMDRALIAKAAKSPRKIAPQSAIRL